MLLLSGYMPYDLLANMIATIGSVIVAAMLIMLLISSSDLSVTARLIRGEANT